MYLEGFQVIFGVRKKAFFAIRRGGGSQKVTDMSPTIRFFLRLPLEEKIENVLVLFCAGLV